jgi:hypothetical protein
MYKRCKKQKKKKKTGRTSYSRVRAYSFAAQDQAGHSSMRDQPSQPRIIPIFICFFSDEWSPHVISNLRRSLFAYEFLTRFAQFSCPISFRFLAPSSKEFRQ